MDDALKERHCDTCKHSDDGKCAYTEECHLCMWKDQYKSKVESEVQDADSD